MGVQRRRVIASLGPVLLIAIVVGYLVLWLVARPENLPTSRFFGELFGVEAVVLLSLSLVLMTLLTPIEHVFGGLDHVGLWHRRVAVVGVLLLVPHLALVTSPPSPYTTTIGKGLGSLALAGLVFLTPITESPHSRSSKFPSWSPGVG